MAASVTVWLEEGGDDCRATLGRFGVHYDEDLSAATKVVIASPDRAAEATAQTVAPVLVVPMEASIEALRTASEMPVATLAIGKAGAINAALLSVAILALDDEALRAKLHEFRAEQTATVLAAKLP